MEDSPVNFCITSRAYLWINSQVESPYLTLLCFKNVLSFFQTMFLNFSVCVRNPGKIGLKCRVQGPCPLDSRRAGVGWSQGTCIFFYAHQVIMMPASDERAEWDSSRPTSPHVLKLRCKALLSVLGDTSFLPSREGLGCSAPCLALHLLAPSQQSGLGSEEAYPHSLWESHPPPPAHYLLLSFFLHQGQHCVSS